MKTFRIKKLYRIYFVFLFGIYWIYRRTSLSRLFILSIYVLRCDAMGDPRSYSAYLEGEVGSYGWDDELASPSWRQEHDDAEGLLGIRATLMSATLRRFSSRESLVVQVHHRGVTACSRTSTRNQWRRRTCYQLQMLQARGSRAIRA